MSDFESSDENVVAPLSREEHIKNLIRFIQSAEDEIAVFRDSIKDCKGAYVERGDLQKEEVQLAIKAYKSLKSRLDFDDVSEYADLLRDVVV